MPFHHHHKDKPKPEVMVAVADAFEVHLVDLEGNVAAYLEHPTQIAAADLAASLQRLDAYIEQSDRYSEANDLLSRTLYLGDMKHSFGATDAIEVVDDIPVTYLAAQSGLVRAARAALEAGDLDSLETLKAALAQVEATQANGPAESTVEGRDRRETV